MLARIAGDSACKRIAVMGCDSACSLGAGWSNRVYEYAAYAGIPSETCNVYTAVASANCSSLDQCFTCSPEDGHACAPVADYVSACNCAFAKHSHQACACCTFCQAQ